MIDLEKLKKAKVTTFMDRGATKSTVDCTDFNFKEVVEALEEIYKIMKNADRYEREASLEQREWQINPHTKSMGSWLKRFKNE